MDIEIKQKKDNPLLARQEVHFLVHHHGEKTPTRDLIREKLAGQLGGKKGLVVVDNMSSAFGKGQTRGYARIYNTPEALGATEPVYLLKRNKLEDLKPKKKTPEAAAGKAPAAKKK